jgi:hypothetical protein
MNVPDSPQNNNHLANTPSAMDNSDTTISEQSVRKDIITTTLVDFQNSFRLFPLRFDKFSVNHGYLLIAGSTLTFLALSTILDVRFAQLCPDCVHFYNLKSDFTIWGIITLEIALVLVLLAFNGWRRNILPTFQALLYKRGNYSQGQNTDIAREYQYFLNAYQSALLSNNRYVLIAISVITTLVFLLLGWGHPGSPDALLSIVSWFYAIFYLLNYLFLAYFSGVGAWAMGVTGWYIKNLTVKFDLSILPSHPDHCGGLKSLGNFCLNTALIILIGAVFLGLWGIGSNIREGLTIHNLLPDIVLFLFALPLAAVAFFVPLWNIHRKMITRRDVYSDNFADRVAKLEEKIQSALDKGTLDGAKAAREEMEIAQVLHPDKIGYPTWPFDRRILLTFLAPQIVAISSLVVQLIQLLPK